MCLAEKSVGHSLDRCLTTHTTVLSRSIPQSRARLLKSRQMPDPQASRQEALFFLRSIGPVIKWPGFQGITL